MTDAQKRAKAKYNAKYIRQLNLKLNNRTDADILEKLREVSNMQGYIKGLIRQDMKNGI